MKLVALNSKVPCDSNSLEYKCEKLFGKTIFGILYFPRRSFLLQFCQGVDKKSVGRGWIVEQISES